MAHDSECDRIVVELSVVEALMVVAALRQYMPYWSTADELTPAEQLMRSRLHVDDVILKLRTAAA
ncbi:hypothetical protein [Jatrophihabitans sp. GAS493]|uniref:hypothetical protein n=1 Tax=Jatrophihabitans sp. GAS493 TaxID=1907575 RepID=UPI000BB7972A|nr:hypothetical protein [Jatrophihabitans sp. GAS493]